MIKWEAECEPSLGVVIVPQATGGQIAGERMRLAEWVLSDASRWYVGCEANKSLPLVFKATDY